MEKQIKIACWALRIGLAFVFSYAAYTALVHPDLYVRFVPGVVGQIIPVQNFLNIYGGFEVLLALWLLSGKWSFYAAIVSGVLLFTLTTLNLGEINTLFRNVAIIAGAVALATLTYQTKPKIVQPQV